MIEMLDFFNDLLHKIIQFIFNDFILIKSVNLSLGDLIIYSFFVFIVLKFVKGLVQKNE